MNPKQRLQQEMRDAMRARDQQRVNVFRMLLAALEQAQETTGKQAFATLNVDGANIPPDRHQMLSGQMVQDIIQNEVLRRREAIDLFYAGGQHQRAEMEETGIAILESYLGTI